MSQPNSRTTSPDIAKAASLAKAVSLHMEGKLDEALAEINRVLETSEGTLEVFSAKAQIQFELEMYEEAAQSYAKLLSMHPKHANANLNLAVCLERLGRWQEAADFFEKAAEAQPDRVDARLGLGIALLHLEKSDAAAENFEKVLEQQPDNATAQFGKAVTLQLQWNFDEAARIYQTILAGKTRFRRVPHQPGHHWHGSQGPGHDLGLFRKAAQAAAQFADRARRPGHLRFRLR